MRLESGPLRAFLYALQSWLEGRVVLSWCKLCRTAVVQVMEMDRFNKWKNRDQIRRVSAAAL